MNSTEATRPHVVSEGATASAIDQVALPDARTVRHEPSERGARLRRRLVLADLVAAALPVLVVSGLAAPVGSAATGAVGLLAVAVSLPILVVLMHVSGLYHLVDHNLAYGFTDEIRPVFLAVTSWSFVLLLVVSALAQQPLDLSIFAVVWPLTILTVLAARGLIRRIARNASWYRQRVAVVGDPRGVERVLTRIRRQSDCGVDPVVAVIPEAWSFRVVPFEGERPARTVATSAGATAEAAVELIQSEGVQRVLLAGWAQSHEERTELVRLLSTSGVYVDIIAGDPEALLAGASLHDFEGVTVMTVSPPRMTKLGRAAKRSLDVTVSAAGLLLLSPLLAATALMIRMDSAGGAIFRQVRAGKDGEPFKILKFRTMLADAENLKDQLRTQAQRGNLFKLHDDPRVTRVGKRVRRTSIDELPQLWNVLKGDMSLVGPRPLPLDEQVVAEGHFAERTLVRPGITGPWQIHGRSDIPFQDMVRLDYGYVANWSFQEDLRLLIRTAAVVLGRRGAY